MAKQTYKIDHFAREAKRLGYRSRSAFKLIELNQRFRFLKPRHRVLDLGAAPGGWSQVAAKLSHSDPKNPANHNVIAIDQIPIQPIGGVIALTADIFELDHIHAALHTSLGSRAGSARLIAFEVVLSDLAPTTSGQGICDHQQSIHLARQALLIAQTYLKPGGTFLCKVFQGESEQALFDDLRSVYTRVCRAKPKSSKPQSREMFLVGQQPIGAQANETGEVDESGKTDLSGVVAGGEQRTS